MSSGITEYLIVLEREEVEKLYVCDKKQSYIYRVENVIALEQP